MAGIEPATDGLRNRCSTTELHWRPKIYELKESHRSAHFDLASEVNRPMEIMQADANGLNGLRRVESISS